jgi:hypothetical protein
VIFDILHLKISRDIILHYLLSVVANAQPAKHSDSCGSDPTDHRSYRFDRRARRILAATTREVPRSPRHKAPYHHMRTTK